MENDKDPTEPAENLPTAVIGKSRVSVIWVVPVVAAIVTGVVLYKSFWEIGPTITILFQDGSGIRSDQTILQYRGVKVGDVRSIALSKDQEQVVVEVQLVESARGLARGGARFWIVRPEISIGAITGLETIVTGPYIEVLPGTGAPTTKFIGEKAPPVGDTKKGLKIVLTTDRFHSLKPATPVYYRGVPVGNVQDYALSADARHVNIHVFIEHPYTALVNPGSKFWNISGANVDLGLIGVEINMESFQSFLSGGIAFATPPKSKDDKRPHQDMRFDLYDKPEEEWLKWAPAIKLNPK